MALCGSSSCGCALVSVPATTGEINGALPTIDVAGNGTPASPWNLTLNDNWAGAVAAATVDLGLRGVIAYGANAADQAGITTLTAITNCTATWTATAGRYYRTTFAFSVNMTAAGATVNAYITDGAVATVRRRRISTVASATDYLEVSVVETGLSGSITRRGQVQSEFGASATVLGSAGGLGAFLIVEDIGPA